MPQTAKTRLLSCPKHPKKYQLLEFRVRKFDGSRADQRQTALHTEFKCFLCQAELRVEKKVQARNLQCLAAD